MTSPKTVRTIPRLVRASAETYGDSAAIIDGDVQLSFGELAEEVALAARGLISLGLRPGERVGIWASNTHRWVIAALAVVSIGGVVVPLNTRYRGAEVREFLARTQARMLIVEQGFLGYDHLGSLFDESNEEATEWSLEALELLVDIGPSAESRPHVTSWEQLSSSRRRRQMRTRRSAVAAAVAPEDLSDIIFTSGTTGQAKGVQLTHGAPLDLYVTYGEIWGLQPGDRYPDRAAVLPWRRKQGR